MVETFNNNTEYIKFRKDSKDMKDAVMIPVPEKQNSNDVNQINDEKLDGGKVSAQIERLKYQKIALPFHHL